MKGNGKRLYGMFALFLFILSVVFQGKLSHTGNTTPYQFDQDIDQYYSFLVAGVIHKDLSFEFENKYWLNKLPSGKKIQRVTMGMSMMYAPFFTVGHVIATLSDTYENNGYSKPYSQAIRTGTIFYVLLGLYFLMLALGQYFKPVLVVFLGLLVLFGTNLFYYTYGTGELSHSYLFSLNAIFIYLGMKWHKKPKSITLYSMAFVFGLMVLIRPTEIILLLFPLFYGVSGMESFKEKISLIVKHKASVALAVVFFFLPLVPQLLYWKIYGGSFVIYSYGKESFYFDNPQILDYLFSYRKGWLLYTPVMILSLLGLVVSIKKRRNEAWPIVLITLISVYVFSSWWCWWYGGSFGMRTMVELYAFLAFPLGELFLLSYKKLRLAIVAVSLAFVGLNLFNTYQYHHWMIHWDSMSKASYWKVFLRKSLSVEEMDDLQELYKHPDYQKALEGKEEYE